MVRMAEGARHGGPSDTRRAADVHPVRDPGVGGPPATLGRVTPTRTAGQLLVECLAAEGCEYVFSVPGEETMDILDALGTAASATREDGRPAGPRHVTTRHEQGAAFMADVYGRLTGRASVAMATLGPGATNLVTGVADAYLDRAPLVAITGQAGSDKLHKEAHQVVDIVRMIEPVTKWNTRVERAVQLEGLLARNAEDVLDALGLQALDEQV